MDNIKTKLQTQTIKSSCEKIENLNNELDQKLNIKINVKEKSKKKLIYKIKF